MSRMAKNWLEKEAMENLWQTLGLQLWRVSVVMKNKAFQKAYL
jgi:hypothetical protein